MTQALDATLNRKTAWLSDARQSSAAKGNMGASPPIYLPITKPLPDD